MSSTRPPATGGPRGEAHVCVIGAGVMGASAAFQLARHGMSVLLVDRSMPGSEASGATAGTLAVQNKKPDLIPIVLQSLDMWAELSDCLGSDVEYEVRGGFRLAHTDEDVERLEQAVKAQQALGAPVEMVYAPQLHAEAPYLAASVRAASYCPRDGMANPFATVRAFVRAGRALGVECWFNCAVTGADVRGDHDFALRTTRGPVSCSAVIAAAGAWNLEVARLVGVELPIHTELLQAIITDVGPAIFPHVVTHVRGNLTLKQQRVTGKILMGGAWPGQGDRQTGTKHVRRDSLLGNLKWATETIPAIRRSRLLRSWVGFEGRTPDKMLLCGPMGPKGFYILGCSGGGFTLAPVAGRIAAEFVVFGAPRIACEELNVRRFLREPAAQPSGGTS
ncbi:MAG: NAD(P)/FAD-dependent oxidoreductase [Vicinamibacterales bacterium]